MPGGTTPPKVLHLFDRFLNGTMNWAYNLLDQTPLVEQHISAPLLVANDFLKHPDFQYWKSPFQRQPAPDEWHIPASQQWLARIGSRTRWYQTHLLRAIRREEIQILHAHFAGTGCQAIGLARRSGLPLVVSFYGYDYEQLPYRKPVYQKRYRELFQAASLLLVEGSHGAKLLELMGCPKEKIKVVQLGVRVQEIPIHQRTKTTNNLRLLQAATYTEKKGHRYTIQALGQVIEECPNLQLTLLGEKQHLSIFQECKELTRELKLEKNISFLEFVPPQEFHAFLRHFEVFIHPSCYASDRDCEGGAPIVLLDAQATGMPVISTRHCDIPDQVRHRETGWLASERSVDEIAAGIRHFYQMNDATYQHYATKAREWVEQEFSIAESGRTLEQVYQQLLNV
jgi:colanic acid/amylovoran biosynthesis glycosyltransferase